MRAYQNDQSADEPSLLHPLFPEHKLRLKEPTLCDPSRSATFRLSSMANPRSSGTRGAFVLASARLTIHPRFIESCSSPSDDPLFFIDLQFFPRAPA